jgi:hypothetical protein
LADKKERERRGEIGRKLVCVRTSEEEKSVMRIAILKFERRIEKSEREWGKKRNL